MSRLHREGREFESSRYSGQAVRTAKSSLFKWAFFVYIHFDYLEIMEPHYTYIIQSDKDQSYYIGSSKDPEKRLVKHNKPHKGYTARKQPWKLIVTEEYD